MAPRFKKKVQVWEKLYVNLEMYFFFYIQSWVRLTLIYLFFNIQADDKQDKWSVNNSKVITETSEQNNKQKCHDNFWISFIEYHLKWTVIVLEPNKSVKSTGSEVNYSIQLYCTLGHISCRLREVQNWLLTSAELVSLWEPFMVCQKWGHGSLSTVRDRSTVGESTEAAELSVYLHVLYCWQHHRRFLGLWSIKCTATWPFHSTVIYLKLYSQKCLSTASWNYT